MPPAIIVAAVAVGASAAGALGVISITAAVVIATTATVAGTLLTKQNIPSLSGNTTQQERKQVLRAAAAARTIIYGRTITSGLLFFAEEEKGEQDEGEWVHLAIALCGHPIDGVDFIWLGDDDFGTYPSTHAQWELHSGRTTPDPFMLEHCPSWKSDMVGRGITWVRVSLKFDQKLFPAGIPNVKLQIRGKQVYDPRDGVTRWTENVPLIARDYLRWVCEVPPEDIDDNLFVQGANISDEQVAAGSASEARYRMCAIISADDARSPVLDDMCQACAGEMTYIAGKHGMLVGAYYGPATMTLSADQIISDVNIIPESSYSDKINTVTGIFIDPGQGYVEADYPAVKVQAFIDKDGGEYSEDLKLKYVPSEFQAQRLAQIKINRKRLGRTVKLKTNMWGYRYRPGYYVKLDIPMIGINMQEFRIGSWSLDPQGGVDLVLRQETAAVWVDAIGLPIDRPDLTDLPTGAVPPPYNLQYQVQEIGEVVQGVLSWSNVGEIAYNKVIIRQSGTVVLTAQVPGTFTKLSGLLRGDYTAGVIAVSPSGMISSEAFLPFSISAPNPPTAVDVAFGYFQATLTPRSANAPVTSLQYDFWSSGETPLPNTNSSTVENGADRLFIGKQYTTKSDLLVDHKYYYYIRAINAFGASPFIEIAFTYTFNTSELIKYIDSQIKGTEAFKNLDRSAEELFEATLENALANDGDVQKRYKQVDVLGLKLSASIIDIQTIVLTDRSAYAEKFTQLQASVDNNSATVQQVSSAFASLDGKLSAQWGVKVQVESNGTKYIAGMQLGVEGQGGAVQSVALFTADTIGIYNPSAGQQKLAFAVKGGQVFLSEGIFDYASISLAKIGSFYSANYVSGRSGTIMRNDGSFEMYGDAGYSGGVVLNSTGLAVYDGGGVERTKVGRLF